MATNNTSVYNALVNAGVTMTQRGTGYNGTVANHTFQLPGVLGKSNFRDIALKVENETKNLTTKITAKDIKNQLR